MDASTVKKSYTLSVEEWDELKRLSVEAHNTPVMLIGGVDSSQVAHDRVRAYWAELGRTYGFAVETAGPGDGDRVISALPV